MPSAVQVFPPRAYLPPRETQGVGLTHLPMSAPPVERSAEGARLPAYPVQKVIYWLADLFAAPGRAYAQGYQEGYQAGRSAGYGEGYEAGYQAGYEAGRLTCIGGGHTYPDRPRSVWEFRDLYDPDPELFAALRTRYGEAKRPLAEWLALLEGLKEEL